MDSLVYVSLGAYTTCLFCRAATFCRAALSLMTVSAGEGVSPFVYGD